MKLDGVDEVRFSLMTLEALLIPGTHRSSLRRSTITMPLYRSTNLSDSYAKSGSIDSTLTARTPSASSCQSLRPLRTPPIPNPTTPTSSRHLLAAACPRDAGLHRTARSGYLRTPMMKTTTYLHAELALGIRYRL